MRAWLGVTAILLGWLPLATALPTDATFTAERLYITGASVITSDGAAGLRFHKVAQPQWTLTGDAEVLLHTDAGARAGVTYVQDPTSTGEAKSHHPQSTIRLIRWGEDAQVVVLSSAPGQLHIRADAAASALEALTEARTFIVGEEGEAGANLQPVYDDHYHVALPAGRVALEARAFPGEAAVTGAFMLLLYDVTIEIESQGTTSQVDTGWSETDTAGDAGRFEYRRAVVRLTDGHLALPGGAPVAYLDGAGLVGEGALTFSGATGILRDGTGTLDLRAADMELRGAYQAHVRPGAQGGWGARVSGDLEHDLTTAAIGAAPAAPEWAWFGWILGVAVAAGAGGAYTVWRRAGRTRVPEVPEAKHVEPDFAWADLQEQFSVIRAGERAGVVVVLVAADRLQNFLQSVVGRGIMAEDTGDRVQAGMHELAVVALEPSPIMMN